jgi:hypothetical protein
MPAFNRLSIAALALVLGASTVAAQPAPEPSSLSACRLESGQVAVQLTFEGGACQQPGKASVVNGGSIVSLSLPTVSTSEVCTMQVVPVSWSGNIDAAESAKTLSVEVLGPQGQLQAMGDTAIAGSEGCTEAGSEATK